MRLSVVQHQFNIPIEGLHIDENLWGDVESRRGAAGSLPHEQSQLRPFTVDDTCANVRRKPLIELLQTDDVLLQFLAGGGQKVRLLLCLGQAIIFQGALKADVAGEINTHDRRENCKDLTCEEFQPAKSRPRRALRFLERRRIHFGHGTHSIVNGGATMDAMQTWRSRENIDASLSRGSLQLWLCTGVRGSRRSRNQTKMSVRWFGLALYSEPSTSTSTNVGARRVIADVSAGASSCPLVTRVASTPSEFARPTKSTGGSAKSIPTKCEPPWKASRRCLMMR